MQAWLQAAQSALPDNIAESVATILIAILTWYISRKKTQAREREDTKP